MVKGVLPVEPAAPFREEIAARGAGIGHMCLERNARTALLRDMGDFMRENRVAFRSAPWGTQNDIVPDGEGVRAEAPCPARGGRTLMQADGLERGSEPSFELAPLHPVERLTVPQSRQGLPHQFRADRCGRAGQRLRDAAPRGKPIGLRLVGSVPSGPEPSPGMGHPDRIEPERNGCSMTEFARVGVGLFSHRWGFAAPPKHRSTSKYHGVLSEGAQPPA